MARSLEPSGGHNIDLYYGVKDRSEAYFLDELRASPTAGRASGSSCPGDEQGFMTAALIRECTGDVAVPVNRSPLVALLRSAASNERAAVMFREFITREIFARIMKELDVTDPDLRASLVATQLMSVAFMRYVMGVEPLASTPGDRLADTIAPTLQRYLTEPLP